MYFPLPADATASVVTYDLRPQRTIADSAIAAAISPAVRESLEALFARLHDVDWSAADVVFAENGSVGILWCNERAYAYFDVLPNGRIHYYLEPATGSVAEQVVETAPLLPDATRDVIRSATTGAEEPCIMPLFPTQDNRAALISIPYRLKGTAYTVIA